MNKNRDVIVFDEEYSFAANRISGYGDALIQLIEGYTTNLETILEVAIQDEKISTQLRVIVEQLEPMKSRIESLCKEAKSLCETYVTETDSADQFLY